MANTLEKTTLRGRQTEPGFTTSEMGRIYSYNSRPHTGQNDQGTEHKLKHKLLQCRQSGPCEHRVPILLLIKKSRTFPGLSRTPMKNFPGPFRSPRMFKYKEKTAFTYNIQSVVHCRKFPFEPLEKCMTFKDIFPGLSRTLSFNFQDFPGPK